MSTLQVFNGVTFEDISDFQRYFNPYLIIIIVPVCSRSHIPLFAYIRATLNVSLKVIV